MRPPVLPSGNQCHAVYIYESTYLRFNEAAGFTQRKLPVPGPPVRMATVLRFNEAAGFTQRKLGPAGLLRM